MATTKTWYNRIQISVFFKEYTRKNLNGKTSKLSQINSLFGIPITGSSVYYYYFCLAHGLASLSVFMNLYAQINVK